MIAGRLKRSAGSSPSTTLVTKHSAMHCSTSHGSGSNRSSDGVADIERPGNDGGPPKSSAEARLPPRMAMTSASLRWYRTRRQRLAPIASLTASSR